MPGDDVFLGGLVFFAFQRKHVKCIRGHFQDLLPGHHTIAVPFVSAEGHELYESDMDRFLFCPPDEINDLSVIEALHDHNIHLYMQSLTDGQCDVAPDPIILIPAGHEHEPILVERIQADIEGGDAGLFDDIHEFMQTCTVGGEGQSHAQGTQATDDVCRILPDQRLSAGQPDLIHPIRCEDLCDGLNFIGLHEPARRREFIFLFGHAIETAEIAIVREGDPQIVMHPVETVDDHMAVF